MSENSNIEWCDHTWSPWEGCQKVGPGCDHCYAEARNSRFGGGTAVNWGAGAPRRRTAPDSWRMPLRWDRKARELGQRFRIFPSLCDPFDNAVDPAWRRDLFELIARTPNLDWLLLTKRIGNARDMLNEVVDELSHGLNTWDELAWPTVWLGATIVNQAEADRDISKLLAVPARVRFLSMEPLLGPVSFDGMFASANWRDCTNALEELDWLIAGGESGRGARPIHPDWARHLRDQCVAADVPFFFKQWGQWRPATDATNEQLEAARAQGWVSLDGAFHDGSDERVFRPGDERVISVGKKLAGRILDDVIHHALPSDRSTTGSAERLPGRPGPQSRTVSHDGGQHA